MDIVHRKLLFLIAFGYFLVFIPASSVTVQKNICTVPSQPANGYRQLYKLQCQSQQSNCDVQEGTKLPTASLLIYTCNPGYKISNSSDVFCDPEGNWLNIPVCTEIRCQSLASASTNAQCTLNGEWVSCESPVLPGTIAELSCRSNYQEFGKVQLKQKNQVTCNDTGHWEPKPIRCLPIKIPLIINGAVNGYLSTLSKVPWHATLYKENISNGLKHFVCGATIIKEKFLLTAAHCIYDETYRRIENPNKYYIATGNIFRDYDSIFHDRQYVKKARVKGIYVPCNYVGYEGNYANDIAIVEIERPFEFSHLLLPACLNGDFIESGLGVASGFGRTHEGYSSYVLQSVSLPYVPLSQCKSSENYVESENLITMDKFCAGYTNGTSVCDGDSGGGLVFQTGNVWFLRGIVSLSLGKTLTGGTTICDSNSYSLHTRISNHIKWIQDTLFQLETSKSLPACRDSTIANATTSSPAEFIPTSTSTITSSPSV
ncbi:limulus clotting factor C-like isoform X2 [Polistes fuscatus]|uniref:limulus clotting factor C-like isoform X2 n=1 Tax=Polistes fuscatus TaxID=30207 RepID=UPI001CA89566|nr:limulus clotting factor C-like isoform X2 [Polistes fuscatus]